MTGSVGSWVFYLHYQLRFDSRWGSLTKMSAEVGVQKEW